MPPTRIDRARAIFWLQLTSLLVTGWVVWKIAIPPYGVVSRTIFLALWYSLAALLLSGAITFVLLLVVRRIERAEAVGVSLRTCAAGVWFAPAAILLGSSAPLATVAALALVVSVTRVLCSQWRLIPRQEPAAPLLVPHPQTPFVLGELPTGFLPRDFWPAMAVAVALQLGLVFTSLNRESTAAAFYAVAAALLTAYGIAAGVWHRQRPPVLPRAIMAVAVTLLLTVLITVIGTVMLMRGGGGSGASGGEVAASHPPPAPPPPLPAARAKYEPPPIDPSRLGPAMNVPGGFPGVILWPELAPVPMLVEPLPKGDGLSRRPPSQPFVIPFAGAYWMFRWPFTRPPANSFVRRGTPADSFFSTVDGWPLTMEAHQRLDRAIDLNCCSKVLMMIRNADRYPGTIAIELGLIRNAGRPSTLGSVAVLSVPDLSRDPVVPVEETLEFTVPDRVLIFDEFDVIYRRQKIREGKSAHIAIEKFVLVPR